MLRDRISRILSKLPIVRLMHEHRDERAAAEEDRARLKREQHEMTQRMHVVGWLAEVSHKHREGTEHGR